MRVERVRQHSCGSFDSYMAKVIVRMGTLQSLIHLHPNLSMETTHNHNHRLCHNVYTLFYLSSPTHPTIAPSQGIRTHNNDGIQDHTHPIHFILTPHSHSPLHIQKYPKTPFYRILYTPTTITNFTTTTPHTLHSIYFTLTPHPRSPLHTPTYPKTPFRCILYTPTIITNFTTTHSTHLTFHSTSTITSQIPFLNPPPPPALRRWWWWW